MPSCPYNTLFRGDPQQNMKQYQISILPLKIFYMNTGIITLCTTVWMVRNPPSLRITVGTQIRWPTDPLSQCLLTKQLKPLVHYVMHGALRLLCLPNFFISKI